MTFDIYTLDSESGIRVILNEELKERIVQFIKDLKRQKTKLKDFSKDLGISYHTLWKYLNKKNSIPLKFFKNLKENYKINLLNSMKYLESGPLRNKIKLVTKINESLAKILGAHIADGNLRSRKTKWGDNPSATHYELVIREEYLSNILAFHKWFYSVFGVNIPAKKRQNHYEIYISNKIIFKYLKDLFKIPTGRKAEIISVPKIIKNSNIKIKKSFLQGLFMFDGSVNYRNGYVSLISKSKNLITETSELLNEIGIKSDYISLKPDKYKRYRLVIRKLPKLRKSLILFEENTEKWYRLKEHLFGLGKPKHTNKPEILKNLLFQLDKFYPRKRKSSITFNDVIIAVETLKEANLMEISKFIKRKSTITYEYLSKLEKWNILRSKRKGLNKLWRLNQELPIIRRK